MERGCRLRERTLFEFSLARQLGRRQRGPLPPAATAQPRSCSSSPDRSREVSSEASTERLAEGATPSVASLPATGVRYGPWTSPWEGPWCRRRRNLATRAAERRNTPNLSERRRIKCTSLSYAFWRQRHPLQDAATMILKCSEAFHNGRFNAERVLPGFDLNWIPVEDHASVRYRTSPIRPPITARTRLLRLEEDERDLADSARSVFPRRRCRRVSTEVGKTRDRTCVARVRRSCRRHPPAVRRREDAVSRARTRCERLITLLSGSRCDR